MSGHEYFDSACRKKDLRDFTPDGEIDVLRKSPRRREHGKRCLADAAADHLAIAIEYRSAAVSWLQRCRNL